MQRVSAWLAQGSFVLIVLPLYVAACAHRDPADRSVEQLKADITQLQADRDRLDQRLVALEAAERQGDLGEGHKPVTPAPDARSSPESPRRLPVVRVGETETPEDTVDTDIDGADRRPIVQATGAPGAKRGRSRNDPAPDALSPEAKRSYDSALGLVRSKQYDKALDALAAFLVRYPDHPYVENATYWRGECLYAKGEFARAAEQFEGLVARFPYGNKAPDALLKLGLCQQRLGSPEQAQRTFGELKDRYPKSDAARQIPRS
jgi:tol-pal system protein YbgF